MKLNKFRLGRSIVYDPWTFEEMAYAPNVMEQKHNIAQQSLMDTDTGLDFEYFEQDDPYVAPKVESLRNKINNVSNQLAKQGVNPQLQNELVSLKREYNREVGPQGTLGRASKSYADAMNQWSAWQKANSKASQQYQEKAKDRFFSGFKGSFDEMGKYQGFSPGSITGERDIMQDFTDFAKKTGKGAALQEFIEGKVQLVPTQVGGETFIKVIETTPGIVSSNKEQLQGLVDQFMGEYSNKNTDRGLYADIAGLDKNYLASTLSNMQRALYDESYAKQPTWNASVQRIPPRESTGVSPVQQAPSINWGANFNFPVVDQLQNQVNNPAIAERKAIQKSIEALDNPEVAKNYSYDNVYKNALSHIKLRYPNLSKEQQESMAKKNTEGFIVGEGNPFSKTEVYKKEFSDFYTPGMSDKEFLQKVDKYYEEREQSRNRLFSFNSPKAVQYLNNNIIDSKDRFVKVEGKGADKQSWKSLREDYDDKTLLGDVPVFFDENLDIVVQSNKNGIYKTNQPVSTIHSELKNTYKSLKEFRDDHSWTEQEIAELNNSPNVARIPGSYVEFKIKIAKVGDKNIKYVEAIDRASGAQEQIPLDTFIDRAYKSKAQEVIYGGLSIPN